MCVFVLVCVFSLRNRLENKPWLGALDLQHIPSPCESVFGGSSAPTLDYKLFAHAG
jgi:hypothetical protein